MIFKWSRPWAVVAVAGAVAFCLGTRWLQSLGFAAMFFGVTQMVIWRPGSHWRRFNVMLRITGIWFTFGALVFLAAAGGLMGALDHPENAITGSPRLDMAIGGGLTLAIGAAFLILRPYRPDLNDRHRPGFPWIKHVPPPPGQRKSWWTGEPKPMSSTKENEQRER